MTRRGTLIYYLASWILGTFFMSLSIWAIDAAGASGQFVRIRSAFGLILFYFYGLILGFLPSLVDGFLLRRVMTALRCKTAWHWAGVGAVLTAALVEILGRAARWVAPDQAARVGWPALLLLGPRTVLEAGWWLAIPAGAVTGYLLCRIQGNFSPRKEEIVVR
jgi:hypothetical protein